MPAFNNYLDEGRVRRGAGRVVRTAGRPRFRQHLLRRYAVLKPLWRGLADKPEQIANPLCELNRWLALLPAAGDYGTQKLFVFRKKC